MLRIALLITLLGYSFATQAQAQCDRPEYRQFDFWIGTWTVTTPNGQVAGTNTITKQLGDCSLLEQYSTPNGYEGKSFNIYDQSTGQWHQTWVDNTGLLLQLDGSLVKVDENTEAMVLWGQGISQQGLAITHRITWTPNQDGTVRQHWQMSPDQGINWQTLFDGLYTKQKDK